VIDICLTNGSGKGVEEESNRRISFVSKEDNIGAMVRAVKERSAEIKAR
jgi:hypothetical protein